MEGRPGWTRVPFFHNKPTKEGNPYPSLSAIIYPYPPFHIKNQNHEKDKKNIIPNRFLKTGS